jgi:hypothetical protein
MKKRILVILVIFYVSFSYLEAYESIPARVVCPTGDRYICYEIAADEKIRVIVSIYKGSGKTVIIK